MSHPYWPQPGYLYRRSVPHAPTAASMGAYTHGYYEPKIPWPLPDYVAAEPTGLDGYYGLGSFDVPGVGTVTCDPAQVIDKIVGKLPFPLSMASSAVAGYLKSLSAGVFQTMLEKVGQGQTAFTSWFNANLAAGIASATGVSQSLVTGAAGSLFTPLQQALNECRQSVAPTSGEMPALPAGWCWQQVANAQVPVQCGSAPKPMQLDLLIPDAGQSIDLTPEGIAHQANIDPRVAAGQIQLVNQGVNTQPYIPTATGAAAAGGSSAVLLGAAALALLMLLR